MPNVLTIAGFRFYVWPDDHQPPHVHVCKAGTWLVINLEPLSLRRVEGMTKKDARRALEIAALFQDKLLDAWRQIHG